MNKLFQTITLSDDKADAPAPQVSGEQGAAHSKLIIRDLKIDMEIGVYAEELNTKQCVLLNIEMDVEPYQNWQKDDILDVICYDQTVQKIQKLAASKHFNLVEFFAEEIAQMCLQDQRCHKVLVRVEKLEAIAETKSVGIEITRQQVLC